MVTASVCGRRMLLFKSLAPTVVLVLLIIPKRHSLLFPELE
jgi:hypothetical protein